MPPFDPPFAAEGERRLATADEQRLGHNCGPADRMLFNGWQNLIEGQFKHLGDQAGINPNEDGDHTFAFRAIQALIAAATGGGGTGDYVLLSQARSKLPIYPEVQAPDGIIPVNWPAAGTVRLPGGFDFLHRGIFTETTVQTDFSIDANKIYHLRWSLANGYELKDLADSTYNPTSAAETHTVFDTQHDDMLIARIITNSSNIPTITNLTNLYRLTRETNIQGTPTSLSSNFGTSFTPYFVINWSRRPEIFAASGFINTGGAGALERPPHLTGHVSTRYQVRATVEANWNENFQAPVNLTAQMHYQVGA